MMRVRVDRARCQGHARCWDLYPEVFEIDDDGYSAITEREIPPGTEHQARGAAIGCPERAITIEDEPA